MGESCPWAQLSPCSTASPAGGHMLSVCLSLAVLPGVALGLPALKGQLGGARHLPHSPTRCPHSSQHLPVSSQGGQGGGSRPSDHRVPIASRQVWGQRALCAGGSGSCHTLERAQPPSSYTGNSPPPPLHRHLQRPPEGHWGREWFCCKEAAQATSQPWSNGRNAVQRRKTVSLESGGSEAPHVGISGKTLVTQLRRHL